jgi:ATP-binding protein involved in chromosome partitioning
MTATISKESVLEALGKIPAPGTGSDIVSLGYVKDLESDDEVSFRVVFQGPLTPARIAVEAACRTALEPLGAKVKVELAGHIGSSFGEGEAKGPALGVKNFVAVGSGKGGVGKSSMAANLAVGLAKAGARVGILDTDVYGPSIPLLFGVTRQAFMEEMAMLHAQGKAGSEERPLLVPYEAHGVKTMSLGYLVEEDKAAIWRGPMVHGAVQQLIRDVQWGELDYMIIDMPPGTGDVHLTLSQTVTLAGLAIVCTPQPVALADARKARQMCEATKTECLGIVENMTGPIFGEGGARDAAEEWKIPFLGSIPMEAAMRVSGDKGTPILAQDDASGPMVDALWDMIDRVTAVVAKKARARPRSLPIRRS